MVDRIPTPSSALRVIAPPSRADVHPLRVMLERAGAQILEAPGLRATTPSQPAWDQAIAALASANVLVVSGAPSASALLEAVRSSGVGAHLEQLRVAAIGGGAAGVLRREGVRVDISPRRHTADEVAGELGDLAGKLVVLVRVEGSERGLPDAIRARGARAIEVPGYRMVVDSTTPGMDRLTTESWDVVAFANPTAVRYFAGALEERALPLERVLAGVRVAVAGPATGAAAHRLGMTPDIIAGGTLRSLVDSIVA